MQRRSRSVPSTGSREHERLIHRRRPGQVGIFLDRSADPAMPCGASLVGYRCFGTDSLAALTSSLLLCLQWRRRVLHTRARDQHLPTGFERRVHRGASGYACTGPDTPAQANPVLCSAGKAEGSKTTYCCSTYTSPTCTLSTAYSECSAMPYAICVQRNGPPVGHQFLLRCNEGRLIAGVGDYYTLFCCIFRDISVNTCAPIEACNAVAGRHSCTGSDLPSDHDPSIDCGSTWTTYGGKNYYCCE